MDGPGGAVRADNYQAVLHHITWNQQVSHQQVSRYSAFANIRTCHDGAIKIASNVPHLCAWMHCISLGHGPQVDQIRKMPRLFTAQIEIEEIN
jgi:hypothetical protein